MTDQIAEELIEAGRGYEALFVPALFQPWTTPVLDAARVGSGCHVLDVACGTGVLSRGALERVGSSGRVVGADPAPGMIAAALEFEPRIDWRQCAAESLDAESASFDCVVSQFGMMFFEDRQKSAEEMFRVLKPGGSLAVAVWRSVEHNPAYADVIAVLQEQVGTAAADALRLPYSLGDAEAVGSILEAAGFADVATEARIETARFPGSRQMVEAELRGWLPLFDIFLEEDAIQQVLLASDERLAKYGAENGEAVFPTAAHIFSATRPG